MVKKLLLCIMMSIFLISIISASQSSLGTFKHGDCINLLQTCEDCTYNNITSVTYPNSSQALGEVEMTKVGTTYNYQFCNTALTGIYIVNGLGDLHAIDTTWNYNFEVTATGGVSSTGKSITYMVLFIFSIIIFIGLLVLGIKLPANNQTNEMTGYIIAVSNMKYVKLTCIGFAWIFGVFIMYFSWMLSYSYLDMPFISDILRFVFYTLAILTLPMFIFFVYLTIANLVRDSKISESLQRGFQITE